MNPEDFYHVGIVVDDLTAAMERLTAAGGYSWTKPVEYTVAITTAAGDIDVPFRFVYSLQAPHLELVQQVPGTLWTSPPGRAAHHLGYWVDDIGATAAALEAAGREHPQWATLDVDEDLGACGLHRERNARRKHIDSERPEHGGEHPACFVLCASCGAHELDSRRRHAKRHCHP